MAFEETQKLSPVLLGAVAAFVMVIAVVAASQMPARERLAHFLLAATPLLLIGALYFWVQLRTEVRRRTLEIRFRPFGGMTIPLKDIRSVEVIEYRPLRDFGGWGVRYGRGGKMYNARGDQAVRLDVRSKGIVHVGSARPAELAAALKS